MKLKKIEILGFKSFAEKTVVEFHEGITCVVGPNGCGKSNIGDAIRWVLGEQSAKAMRGGKMPDVIFAGASSKKALNFAEVTITFSEVNGELPLDFQEVAVTRKLHRSGESEYFINKQAVRLKDIHSLFLDSGIGKNNISFFEQGKIDQLIQYSPEERRTIFEEAAGITRFLQRKREAFRKLEDVNLNLSRVDDIKGEIDKQIVLLESQAEAANLFKNKKGQLEIYEKEHLLLRYTNYARKQVDLKAKESEFLKKQADISANKDLVDQALVEKKSVYEDLEKKYRTARDLFLFKQNEKDLKTQSARHTEEQIKGLIAKEEKILQEVASLKTKQSDWTSEVASLGTRREALSKQLKEAKESVAKSDLEFQGLEKELQELRKNQTEAYRTKVNAYQKQASLQNEVKQLKFRADSNLEKKEQLEVRGKGLTEVIQGKELELKSKEEAFHQIELGVANAKLKFQKIDTELKVAVEQTEKAKKEVQEQLAKFHEKSAKLKALLHLRQEFAGFTSGGKQLLQSASDPKNPIYGLLKGLYEYIVPKNGYEPAVSTALKVYSQTLVAESRSDFEKVLTYAKEKTFSDFSLICLESFDPKAFVDSSFIAESTIGSHLLSSITEEKTWQDALNKALKQSKASWISPGWFIDSKGVLFAAGANESTVFTREAEIRSLEKELEVVIENKTASESALTSTLQQEQTVKIDKASQEKVLRETEMTAMEMRFALQKTQSELARLIKEKSQVEDEVKGLLKYIQGVLAEHEAASEVFKTASTGLEQISNELTLVEQALSSKNSLALEKKQAFQKAESEVRNLDADFRKISHHFHTLEAQNAETTRLIKRLEGDLEANKTAREKWVSQSQNTTQDLSVILTALEKAKEEATSLELNQTEFKNQIQGTEKQCKELAQHLKEIEGKVHQAGIQLAHVETGQNSVLVELQERYPSFEKDELPTLNLTLEKIEKEIQEVRKFLELNQNVNLAAIEECEKQKERAQFLEVQVADLMNAKNELLKMISGLDQKSRFLFKTTFDQIRTNFQKNFQILFKGGEADLELLEAEDILDAGVEITAKPPGKQMRSLSLLSGGEKCLTAMALLFAIFEVKSSPFCILDEIDAPLDDSNVERFLNVVKQFIDRCQFIIVTHNKRTMALADRLYGVSMEEKGISKILFMEFSEKTTQLVGV